VNASLRTTNACPFGRNYQWIVLELLCLLEYNAASVADMLVEVGGGHNLCYPFYRWGNETETVRWSANRSPEAETEFDTSLQFTMDYTQVLLWSHFSYELKCWISNRNGTSKRVHRDRKQSNVDDSGHCRGGRPKTQLHIHPLNRSRGIAFYGKSISLCHPFFDADIREGSFVFPLLGVMLSFALDHPF
jgi:hypothetical protein